MNLSKINKVKNLFIDETFNHPIDSNLLLIIIYKKIITLKIYILMNYKIGKMLIRGD